MRSLLVGGQVAVSMLLLITAGLLVRGLTRARVADPGFDTRGLYLLTAISATIGQRRSSGSAGCIERLSMAPECERRGGRRGADDGHLDAADGRGPESAAARWPATPARLIWRRSGSRWSAGATSPGRRWTRARRWR